MDTYPVDTYPVDTYPVDTYPVDTYPVDKTVITVDNCCFLWIDFVEKIGKLFNSFFTLLWEIPIYGIIQEHTPIYAVVHLNLKI